MGVVLDFKEKTITVDQISLKMKDLYDFLDSKSLMDARYWHICGTNPKYLKVKGVPV